jgi:hypothetical protein
LETGEQMTNDRKNNKLTRLEKDNPGFITGMSRTVRLVLRLMADRRVNFFLKLLPIGALVYMVVPEAFPVVDDAIVLGIGTYMFIELCPPDVVEEHRAQLAGVDDPGQSGEVVDVSPPDEQEQ